MKEQDGREEILRYVEQYGVRDKDAAAARGPRRTRSSGILTARNRKGVFRMTIDLHGMVSIDAERTLSRAMDECQKRGIKELLIIHGKGSHSEGSAQEVGVLKKMVSDDLEFRYTTRVRSFGPALSRDGGDGATVVILK
jgi:DNA-nicking Smr family endonuclease